MSCTVKNSIRIGYSYDREKIWISRCCFHKEQVYKVFETKNLLTIDIVEEIKNVLENKRKPFEYAQCTQCDHCDFVRDSLDGTGVMVSVFHNCNARCCFCSKKQKKGTDFAITKIAYMLTLYRLRNKNVRISLTDAGEPLFLTREMKNWFRSLKPGDFIDIFFNTNGILIDNEFIELFKNCPVPIAFNISLNATDRETYKKQMGVDAFDKVVSNINKISEEAPNILSSVSFVYTKNLFNKLDNIREVVKSAPLRFVLQNNDPKLFTKEELDYYNKISSYGITVQC